MADKLGLAVVSEKNETSERGLKLTLYFHIFDDGAFNVKRASEQERNKERNPKVQQSIIFCS
jgi:hypothetical protein